MRLRLVALAVLLLVVLWRPVTARLADLVPRRVSIAAKNMAPTLRPGDQVSCSRSAPDRVGRGSVVVFRGFGDTPRGTSTKLVSRVVGLPGERVAGLADGSVTVDGRALAEPYAQRAELATPFDAVEVPPASYFLLGDNRGGSSDSRFHGPVAHGDVESVCRKIVAPRDRRGRIPGT